MGNQTVVGTTRLNVKLDNNCVAVTLGRVPVNIIDNPAAIACERRLVSFGHRVPVPSSGELYLDQHGGVNTFDTPVPLVEAHKLFAVGVSLDVFQAGYTFELLVGAAVIYSLALTAAQTYEKEINIQIAEDQNVQARITGPTGSQSNFSRINVIVALACPTFTEFDTVIDGDADTIIDGDGNQVVA